MNPSRSRFFLLFLGQLAVSFGIGLTGFVLGVWVLQETGSAGRYSLISTLTTLPSVLLSPLAGSISERWSPRAALAVACVGSAACSVVLAMLSGSGRLELWHVYALLTLAACMFSLHEPNLLKAVTGLVPREQIVRASGMLQLTMVAQFIGAPIVAGLIANLVRPATVIAADAVLGLLGAITLLVLPAGVKELRSSPAIEAFREGFAFLKTKPGLIANLVWTTATWFFGGAFVALALPLLLTAVSVEQSGVIIGLTGLGMIVGAVAVGLLPPLQRRIPVLIAADLLCGVAIVLAAIRPSVVLITVGGFLYFFTLVVTNSFSQAVWQLAVPYDLQARVMAIRRAVTWSSLPLSYIVAGPLADRLSPLVAPGGALADVSAWLVGVGPGRGIALVLLVAGFLKMVVALLGGASVSMRSLDDA